MTNETRNAMHLCLSLFLYIYTLPHAVRTPSPSLSLSSFFYSGSLRSLQWRNMSQHIGSTHVLNCCVNFAVKLTSSSPFFFFFSEEQFVLEHFLFHFFKWSEIDEKVGLFLRWNRKKKRYTEAYTGASVERERNLGAKRKKKKCNKTIEKVVPSDELIQSSTPWAAFFFLFFSPELLLLR